MKKQTTILVLFIITILIMTGCSNSDGGFNKKLKDEKLIAALREIVVEEQFAVASTIEIFGMSIDDITYVSGKNTRTESGDGSVNIFNAAEHKSYSYITGQNTGYVSLTDNQKFYNLDEIYDSPGAKARIEKYNDEDVVLIETIEDADSARMEVWVSIKYAYPVKVNMYLSDQLLMSQVVTEIREFKTDSDALFTPPADIVFEDYSNAFTN
ncbi:MAG: hypothetical protein JXQ23_00210 [Clostridia bacterium]|nr:hypothetical protein [Clostridia bacterium]